MSLLPWLNNPRRPLGSPRQLPNLAAWFDALDVSSILSSTGAQITDGGSVALWGDKSGNSNTLAFVSGGAASNTATTTTKSLTGSQTMTFDIALSDWTPSADHTLFSKLNGNSGLEVLLLTTGVVRVRVGDGAAITNFDSTAANTCTDLTRHTLVITYVDNTSVAFTIDGVALGTTVVVNKTLANGAATATIGTSFAGRIYRVQIGTVYDFNPSTTTKLSTSLTDGGTGGGTWTINTSGATGARISGERDLWQGTVANRPIWLQYAGVKYGWLNGTSGTYFSTPDSSASSVTGDIEIIICVQLSAYTSTQRLINKSVTAGQKSYEVYLDSTGVLTAVFSSDGTATTSCNSSAIGVSANDKVWFRIRRVSSTGAVAFDKSSDGTTYSSIGTGSTTAGNIFNGSDALTINSNSASFNLNGRVFYASISSTIGGAAAVIFDPSLYTSGTTFTASTGEVWTVNGSAHIVTRTGLYGNGSSTAMQPARYSISQPNTVYVFGQQVTWTSGDYIIDGGAANTGAITQTTGTPQINISAGSSVAGNTGFALKTFGMLRAVFNGASSLLGVNRVAATTGDAGAGVANGITVWASGSLGNQGNAFISEVIQYSGAHADAVSGRMAIYGGRRHSFAP